MATRAALILAGAVLLAIAIAVLLSRTAEPRFKGRTLEQWIQANSQRPHDSEAREAIVTITTNSVPILLQRLAADTSSESRLEAKLPASLRENSIINRLIYRQRDRAAYSVRAFKISGTNAACAIPAVAQLLIYHNSLQVKAEASIILSEIGPAALPAIRQAMSSTNALVRALVVTTTGWLGTNSAPLIPDVVTALTDPDLKVRIAATNFLGTLDRHDLINLPAK